MTYTFKLSRRMAVSRASGMSFLLLLALACSSDLQENSDPALADEASTLGRVEITPAHVVAEVGQTVRLTARREVRTSVDYPARRAGTRTWAPATDVQWSVTGGTITTEGEFSANVVGSYKVVGKGRGPKKDTTVVEVVPRPKDPVALTVDPDTALLAGGASRTFVAKAILRDSSLADVGVTWQATGGTIDAGGVFVAGPRPRRVQGHREERERRDGRHRCHRDRLDALLPSPGARAPGTIAGAAA